MEEPAGCGGGKSTHDPLRSARTDRQTREEPGLTERDDPHNSPLP
jgi:hypothetical protein